MAPKQLSRHDIMWLGWSCPVIGLVQLPSHTLLPQDKTDTFQDVRHELTGHVSTSSTLANNSLQPGGALKVLGL